MAPAKAKPVAASSGARPRRCAAWTRGLALACVLASQTSPAQVAGAFAPNVVEITPRLVTSGQPSVKGLETLRARGFDAVIYLAPPTVSDAVRDEALIVGRQGLVFVDIPIRFDAPTERDYETFAAILAALGPRKILVHCQVNMRASTMVFLYRVLALKEDPNRAYEAVTAVWVPEGPWKRLVADLLSRHGVKFEIY